MANGKYEYKEIRFVIEPELTQVYVLINADHECPIGVQGWHHKTFSASKNVEQILGVIFTEDHCLYWPLNAPSQQQPTQ